MIDLLITYLPLSRISDIENYFEPNVRALKPEQAIVYIDGASAPEIPFESRVGNWTDRTSCLMDLLLELKGRQFENAYIVDSDNLIGSGLQEIDSTLGPYYNVMEEGRNTKWFEDRTTKQGFEIYRTRWLLPFFMPKQGIRMSKGFVQGLNEQLIYSMKKAMQKVHPAIRNFMSDEETLGILYYYSGIHFVPWVKHGRHLQSSRPSQVDYSVTARVHSIVARELLKEKFRKEIFWCYLRYRIAHVARAII